MNKKGLSTIVTTSLIILITIVGVSLVWKPIENLRNPQFNITVEECKNEKIYLPDNVDLRFEFEEFNSFDDKGFSLNLSSADLGKPNVIYFYYKEVCKDVEVKLDWENICIDMVNNNKGECFYMKGNGIKYLDENCECKKRWREKPCPKGYKPTTEDNEGKVFCNAPYINSACHEYKCGDYKVEVMR